MNTLFRITASASCFHVPFCRVVGRSVSEHVLKGPTWLQEQLRAQLPYAAAQDVAPRPFRSGKQDESSKILIEISASPLIQRARSNRDQCSRGVSSFRPSAPDPTYTRGLPTSWYSSTEKDRPCEARRSNLRKRAFWTGLPDRSSYGAPGARCDRVARQTASHLSVE